MGRGTGRKGSQACMLQEGREGQGQGRQKGRLAGMVAGCGCRVVAIQSHPTSHPQCVWEVTCPPTCPSHRQKCCGRQQKAGKKEGMPLSRPPSFMVYICY